MLALLLFLTLLIIYFIYSRLSSPLAKIPGPSYNIFTSLPIKYHEFTASRRDWIHTLHRQYGPVVRLSPNEVSFASVEAMKEIYTSGGAGYDRTEFYDLFRQFGTRTLFSTPPKAPHIQRKKLFADRYANTNVMRKETLQALQSRAEAFLRNCLSARNGDPDVYVHLHCFALDGASHFLFAPNGTNSLGNRADYEMMEELTYHESLKENWFQYYAPTLSNFLSNHNILSARPSPLANNYVLSSAKQPNPSEISLISKLRSKAAELEEMSAPAECMDHLAAGIDTTGDGLCFLMHQLSRPESLYAQEKLHRELIANAVDVGSGVQTPWEQLPYLDAVIREGLRCFPPIPMSFPRYVPAGGKTLESFFLPAKTIVSCQPWTLHKDARVFPQPEVFRPERWLEEDGRQDRDKMFFAFSQGSRGCIGKNLAMAEMKLLLREVYSKCRTTISKDMKGDMTLADQIISSRPKGQTCLLAFEPISDLKQ